MSEKEEIVAMDDVEEDDDEESEEEEDMDDDREEDKDKEENGTSDGKVYIPGITDTANVAPQDLEFDESTYVIYHEAQSGFPCLSFDIIQEEVANPDQFPITLSFVAGTQADKSTANNLMLIRMSNLHKTQQKAAADDDEDDDEEVSDDDEEIGKKPVMRSISISVDSCINRVRRTKVGDKTFAASWLESGVVQIHDITHNLVQLEAETAHSRVELKPVKQFRGHRTEGFAMDWSSTVPGRFLTGDNEKDIHLWEPVTHSGGWNVDQRPFKGHLSSVEDIQWSPSEKNVFASCSSDKSIRIWDVRAPPHKANMLSAKDAHDADVNVIHWNRMDPFLVSGGDDGVLKIWDLRQFREKKTVATFKQHTAPITSVEWHPTDSSIFAASGADHQVTLWDLAVEKVGGELGDPDVPPQLLFIHLGQNDLKELHWHPQFPGVVLSTAESGFNVFKTISV